MFFLGKYIPGTFNMQWGGREVEAIHELESTGQKSMGICLGCMAAHRHSIVGFEVEHHDVVSIVISLNLQSEL